MEIDNRALMNWLGLLIRAQKWDYGVIWKLGDDPSRFIEWMGCCCSGAYECENVKEEKGKDLSLLCRDVYLKHPVKTKACETLAKLPAFMPLYSGIHTEVVISTEPRWLNNQDIPGTFVLIPVAGGLIELCSSKQIPKNQTILEVVLAHCKVISLEQKSMTSLQGDTSLNEACPFEEQPKNYMENYQPALNQQIFPQVLQSGFHLNIEGSSSTSSPIPSHEHDQFIDLSCDKYETLEHSIKKPSESNTMHYNENLLMQQAGLVSGCGHFVAEKSTTPVIQKVSKNLHSERNRRNRIKEKLYTLRSLVPKITKMDLTSIVGDAVDYIIELQNEKKELEEELKKMDDEDYQDKAKPVINCLPPTPNNHVSSSTICKEKQIRQIIEVKQTGKKECFIKLSCHQKRGGFVRLMEALEFLGMQVINANVTTVHETVQNIIEVEANEEIQPKKLRDSLIKLTQ
ncbi:hypothetical protein UlMin_040282 [Ulmus minor]